MESRIYSVTSSVGVVMGLFSTRERAEACVRYSKKILPECEFEITCDYVDLIEF